MTLKAIVLDKCTNGEIIMATSRILSKPSPEDKNWSEKNIASTIEKIENQAKDQEIEAIIIAAMILKQQLEQMFTSSEEDLMASLLSLIMNAKAKSEESQSTTQS